MDKEALRDRTWQVLQDEGVARFPFPVEGRIPNFTGAKEAARRLADLDEWRRAEVVKANPDSPQKPVRRAALSAGKTVYMAVPRLRDAECFIELAPERVDPARASTIKGAAEQGLQVAPDDVEPVDLIVAGSVAVTADGARIGKGEGYSDLEYALLREVGLVAPDTPVATTVHELQVVDEEVHLDPHDVALNLVVTPKRVIRTGTDRPRPEGIDRELLGDRIEEMPALARLGDRG